MTSRLFCSGLVFLTIAHCSPLVAHEGHGHPEHQNGLLHYLLNPAHSLPVLATVACLAAGVSGWRWLRCRNARQMARAAAPRNRCQ
jgi:hypothetical protein